MIKLIRDTFTEISTIGKLYIDDEFQCYTLEDPVRDKKIYGDTAIWASTYKLELRQQGSMHEKYKKRYKDVHKGMIHITNIPEYSNVYIHVGNTEKDTLGCPLVGLVKDKNKIWRSTDAYEKIYPKIADIILNDPNNAWIEIINQGG